MDTEIKASVIYREGKLTKEDYDEAIEALVHAREQLLHEGAQPCCFVCEDSGHLASMCHHNPLVVARAYVTIRDWCNKQHEELHRIIGAV